MNKFDQAYRLAGRGELSPDAPEWALRNSGKLLAEVAIEDELIPVDFKGWHWLVGSEGATLAHLAAHYSIVSNRLPTDKFTGWYWQNCYNDTVAHLLYNNRQLPADFQGWHWENNANTTVLHFLTLFNFSIDDLGAWHWVNIHGHTIAHIKAVYGIFAKGGITEYWMDQCGVTVAKFGQGRVARGQSA